MTSTRSLPAPTDDDETAKPRRFGLSWTQLAAAGFASITATFLLSYLGISGTLIGAAVFSVASAIGNAVYGQSLRTTSTAVREVVPFGKSDPASPTIVLPVTEDDAEPAEPPQLPSEPLPRQAPVVQSWKKVALFAVAMFATVIATVTAVELIAGRPLTDVVRGDDQGSGTSLFGGTSGKQIQVPTVTVTVTPSVKIVTPTVTQTAPAVTESASPTGTPSTPASGATTPTGVPGTATSGTPSPSQSSSP